MDCGNVIEQRKRRQLEGRLPGHYGRAGVNRREHNSVTRRLIAEGRRERLHEHEAEEKDTGKGIGEEIRS